MSAAVALLLKGLILIYRFAVSPLLGPSCRFAPTCSAYALDAIGTHGPWAGTWMALRRIGRCHPWTPGGYDPVPPPRGLKLPPGNEIRF